MFLSRIKIVNFKSLKDVEINSEGLVALVGPNGSGKTNFALAMKFLSEVHQHGLETAISRAGGFENIAYRKGRRTTAPIEFEVEIQFDLEQMRKYVTLGWLPQSFVRHVRSIVVSHDFACTPCSGGIRAEYVVEHETIRVESKGPRKGVRFVGTIIRNKAGASEVKAKGEPKCLRNMFHWESKVGKQELLISRYRDMFTRTLSVFLAHFGVFHFSAEKIRESGVPTANPALAMPGSNLPVMVDWLQKKQPKAWRGVLDAMQDVAPGLEEITVYPLASKTYGLLFKEEGVKLPWRIDEVSDGTIHALSMLVAAADPRTSALVIEEPESSLHPWIIHELAKKLRELSEEKPIFLTTQSLVVIESLRPSEVWIVSRRKGKTEIRRLTELDKRVEKDWSEGKYGLSEFLDSGLIPRAVPGGRM